MTLEEMLVAIRERKEAAAFGGGIGTADAYLKGIAPCLGDEQCIKDFLGGTTAAGWELMVKDAGNKLVYNDNEMVVVEAKATSVDGFKDIMKRIKGTMPEVPKHCAMVFENVVTSTKEDRDLDILHAGGAKPDPKMLLLWQHIPVNPIGKMLGVSKHDAKILQVVSCILDINKMTADAIKLVEAEAMRISHGFKPNKFSPRSASENKTDRPPGFDVKEYEVLEESLVSVPANTDAVITVFSRGKLTDPLVKSWAKQYFDARPATAPGTSLFKATQKLGSMEVTAEASTPEGLKKALSIAKGEDDGKQLEPPAKAPPVTEDKSEKKPCGCGKGTKAKDDDSEGCGCDCVSCSKCTGKKKQDHPLSKELNEMFAKLVASVDAEGDFEVVANLFAGSKGNFKDGITTREPNGEIIGHIHVIPKGIEPDFSLPRQSKLYTQLKGSWEATRSVLNAELRKHMKTQGIACESTGEGAAYKYRYTYIEAMFNDKAIVVVESRDGQKCYSAGWKAGADGSPKWEGSVKEVEVSAEVREKLHVAEASCILDSYLKISRLDECRQKHAAVLQLADQLAGIKGLRKEAALAVEQIITATKASAAAIDRADIYGEPELTVASLKKSMLLAALDSTPEDLQSLKEIRTVLDVAISEHAATKSADDEASLLNSLFEE